MTHRSIFLAGESFSDVQDKLSRCKTDEELRHAMSERLRANGWTKERELKFREHAATCGFILPGQRAQTRPMERDIGAGSKTRMLLDAVGHELRTSKVEPEMEDQ